MYQNKINELKEKISNLYDLYLKSDNKKQYIIKLAKIFNIHIHEVLANNYKIISIDIDNLSISIEDTRYNINYIAVYTSDSDLFNYKGNIIRFIEVVEIDNNKCIKNVYHIGEEKPVISRMTFENNGYTLEFIKEESNDTNTFLDNSKKLMIRYLENNDEKYIPLLTRIEKRNGEDTFERIFTYDGVNYNSEGNLVDKSIYVVNNDMIYIVDDAVSKNPIGYLKGICFENTHIDINKYKVNGINLDEFNELSSDEIISAIIFKAVVEDELCLIEIYKNSKCINIKYHKKNSIFDNDDNIEVLFENIELPILTEGKISVLEINSIINELKYDTFTNMVTSELIEFSKRMNIKDEIIEEQFKPLSPKLLLDKDFYIIADIISKNKEDYIGFICNEFNLIAGINGKNK